MVAVWNNNPFVSFSYDLRLTIIAYRAALGGECGPTRSVWRARNIRSACASAEIRYVRRSIVPVAFENNQYLPREITSRVTTAPLPHWESLNPVTENCSFLRQSRRKWLVLANLRQGLRQGTGKAIAPHLCAYATRRSFSIARKVSPPPLVMEPACQAFLLLKRSLVEPRTFVQAVEDSDFRFMPHLQHPPRARVL